MRDILFRGKERFNCKWLYGNLVKYRNGEFAIQSMDKDHNVAVPVIADTIGQYTGLTDRNGKKIFEGDIAHYEDKNNDLIFNVEVVFDEYNALYGIREIGYSGYCIEPLNKGFAKEFEVIGNIYDNPEL